MAIAISVSVSRSPRILSMVSVVAAGVPDWGSPSVVGRLVPSVGPIGVVGIVVVDGLMGNWALVGPVRLLGLGLRGADLLRRVIVTMIMVVIVIVVVIMIVIMIVIVIHFL